MIKDIPLLITTAIIADATKTKLDNPSERLKEVLIGLEYWINETELKDIVICDGSNTDISFEVMKLKNKNKNIEILYFRNNKELVINKGKGFGEGEIIKYAIENSVLLKKNENFMKCSGKLFVKNWRECKINFNNKFSFNYYGIKNSKLIDTRFYIVNKSFYENHLLNLHEETDDNNKIYLEKIYNNFFEKYKISQFAMYPVPDIIGFSGSTGKKYTNNKFKIYLKKILILIFKKINL